MPSDNLKNIYFLFDNLIPHLYPPDELVHTYETYYVYYYYYYVAHFAWESAVRRGGRRHARRRRVGQPLYVPNTYYPDGGGAAVS